MNDQLVVMLEEDSAEHYTDHDHISRWASHDDMLGIDIANDKRCHAYATKFGHVKVKTNDSSVEILNAEIVDVNLNRDN